MAIINKRQSKILEVIKDRASMYVTDLIPLFDVSPATMRKDLTFLEELNLVQRTHGEVHIKPASEITPLEHRSIQNIGAKRAIAQKAVSFVHNNMSIILDSGTTTIEIAKLLHVFENLTVITNSLPIALILAESKINVLMPGGMLLGKNLSTQGPDTERYIKKLDVDIAFMASSGVKPKTGFASENPLECSVKQSMMEAARHKCAVVDTSKFAKSGVYLYARFEDFTTIITEADAADSELERFVQSGKINHIVADKK